MKILHYHHNGVGVVLSNEMNTHPDIESKVITTARHPFGFKADYVLPPRIPFLGTQSLSYWILSNILSKRFDILHSHDGIPLPKYVLDKWQGRLVQHYHNPLVKDFYPGLTIPAFVATPFMLTTIPNSVWMPLPVNTTTFHPSGGLYDSNNLVIGFSYNTHADKKKLKYIPIKELYEFSGTHKQVTLKPLVDAIHYTSMPRYYRSLDIYVDRIGLDSYGWQATEAAACGCIIITQYTNVPKDCPFAYATTQTLNNVLHSIVTLPVRMLSNMKQQSVIYAHKYHNVTDIANNCLLYYQNLGDINAFKNSVECVGTSPV